MLYDLEVMRKRQAPEPVCQPAHGRVVCPFCLGTQTWHLKQSIWESIFANVRNEELKDCILMALKRDPKHETLVNNLSRTYNA